MANVLIIKAHPYNEDKSSTVALLNTFIIEYKALHPKDQLTVVDLYEETIPEINGKLLDAWSAEQLTKDQEELVKAFGYYTDQFLAADKVVIANPLWNLHVPVRLKMWLDTITVAQKTFKYTPNGPVGLVPHIKALHIQSSGSPFYGNDPATKYIDNIFHFIGVKEVQHLYIDGKDALHDQPVVKEAHQKAKDIAKTF